MRLVTDLKDNFLSLNVLIDLNNKIKIYNKAKEKLILEKLFIKKFKTRLATDFKVKKLANIYKNINNTICGQIYIYNTI